MYIGDYMIDKSENICLLIKSCAQYYCGKYEDTFKACIDFLSEYMRAHPKSDITVQAYFDLEERVVKSIKKIKVKDVYMRVACYVIRDCVKRIGNQSELEIVNEYFTLLNRFDLSLTKKESAV